MDDEQSLEDVLNEIGGQDPLPTGSPIDITQIQPPIIEEPIEPAKPKTIPLPTPELLAPSGPPETIIAEVKPDVMQIDAAKLVKQYLTVYEKFLNNYDADRGQIEKTILHLEDIVFNVGGAQRVHIEMLVAALRTKSETNGNIVKALDSVAKILAAAKGTQVLINNNNSGSAQQDLAKILEKPPYPDEKR